MGYNGLGVAFTEGDATVQGGVQPAVGQRYSELPDSELPDSELPDSELPDSELANPEVPRDILREVVDDVVESEFVLGLAFARRLRRIDRARETFESEFEAELASTPSGLHGAAREMSRRSFIAELATALKMAERSADRQVETARSLVHELPATLDALSEGRLNQRHAQILVDAMIGLDDRARADLEERMLPVAEKKTPAQFERAVRRLRERLYPETMTERQVIAAADRGVQLSADEDGMSTLAIHAPTVQLVAVKNRVTAIARSLQRDSEERTLSQLEADVACDILLDTSLEVDGKITTSAGSGAAPIDRFRSIRPTVIVTIPIGTVLLDGSEPGDLAGIGPIDAQTAREIASLAPTWRRLLTDPVTGIGLRFGRERYRVPDDLKLWLRVRDGTCRFPGCSRNAVRCELDHTDDWEAKGGSTDHDNLAHLCKTHHLLKHALGGTAAWKVEQLGGGVLRWTSPVGIVHETSPEQALSAD